jgi:hypothetical protein
MIQSPTRWRGRTTNGCPSPLARRFFEYASQKTIAMSRPEGEPYFPRRPSTGGNVLKWASRSQLFVGIERLPKAKGLRISFWAGGGFTCSYCSACVRLKSQVREFVGMCRFITFPEKCENTVSFDFSISKTHAYFPLGKSYIISSRSARVHCFR